MHHQVCLPRRYHQSFPEERQAREPAPRRLVSRLDPLSLATRLSFPPPLIEPFSLSSSFSAAIAKAQPGWRRVVAQSVMWGVPVRPPFPFRSPSPRSNSRSPLFFPRLSLSQIPSHSTALSFFDGYRSEMVPANLIQAQRDYFGGESLSLFLSLIRGRVTEPLSLVSPLCLFSSHLQGPSWKGERSTEDWRGHPRQLDWTRWKHVRRVSFSPRSLFSSHLFSSFHSLTFHIFRFALVCSSASTYNA